MKNFRLAAMALVATTLLAGAEIRVMTSGAFTAAHFALAPVFERAAGHRIVTAATSMGTGRNAISERLQRGEAVDVVIVEDAALDDFIKKGLVMAGSKVPLARSGIGMAVRAGASKPDISTVEALKRTLLQAKSIAYSASVSGRYLSGELFARLGVAEAIAARCKRIEGERVAHVVARGEAEIGFQQISELLPIAGIDYAGPLPPEVQKTSVFSAGVAAGSREQDAAKALIQYLSSPLAAHAILKTGLELLALP